MLRTNFTSEGFDPRLISQQQDFNPLIDCLPTANRVGLDSANGRVSKRLG
jgi:hypothetical protein